MKKWKMPCWMEPFRSYIRGNGDSVESLMSCNVIVQVNAPLALIACGVKMQVGLLIRLHEAGLIVGGPNALRD